METQGESLDLSGKGFRQLNVLSTVQPNILSLKLDNNHVNTLKGIHKFPNLMQLSARANRITDLSPLSQLNQLVILNIQNNAITNIQGLDHTHCLQWVSLAGNTIKDPGGVVNCHSLTHLDLSDNFIQTLPDLSGLVFLKTLLLHGNGIQVLHSAPPLPPSIHTLTLAENAVSDLNEFSSLAPIKSLRQLSLMGNPCTSETTPTGRLIDYRAFILYYCPTVTVLDGITTTDIERHQARTLFFGLSECPFKIGQHTDLIDHLLNRSVAQHHSTTIKSISTPIKSPQHLTPPPNNENSSPNTSPSRGPVIIRPPPDPVSSRSSPRQPLSPRRVTGSFAGKGRSPEIMETLKSLQQIQEMIKAQEQIILSQSTLTSDNEGGVVENESSKVGVVKHGNSKERDDITVVDLESCFSDGMSSLGGRGSVLPRSIKGFGFSSPLEKGAVKIAPRLKYSPTTDSDYLDTLSMSSSVYGEKARESGSMLGTVMEDQSSLASSLSHAYGLTLPETTPTLGRSSDSGTLLSTMLSANEGQGGTSLFPSEKPEYAHSPPVSVRITSPVNSKEATPTEESHTHKPIEDNETITDHETFKTSQSSFTTVDTSVSVVEKGVLPSIGHAYNQGRDGCGSPPSARQISDIVIAGESAGNNLHVHVDCKPSTGFDPQRAFVRQEYHWRLNEREKAAVVIQSLWRGRACRREGLLSRHKAAVVIQAAWRGYYCRVYNRFVGYVYREMKRKKMESYVTLLYLQLMGCREELAHQIGTVQIQEEALKSVLTEVDDIRSELRNERHLKLNKAATVIQKHWRAYHTRKLYGSIKKTKLDQGSVCRSLQNQVDLLQESVSHLAGLLLHQFVPPSPLNLRMSHFSSSCLLVQWDPPTTTPLCTRPLVSWPNIVNYKIYINDEQQGMVSSLKTKAYIEGLDCSVSYRITIKALYEGGKESAHSNPVIAMLSSSPQSNTVEREGERERLKRAMTFSSLPSDQQTKEVIDWNKRSSLPATIIPSLCLEEGLVSGDSSVNDKANDVSNVNDTYSVHSDTSDLTCDDNTVAGGNAGDIGGGLPGLVTQGIQGKAEGKKERRSSNETDEITLKEGIDLNECATVCGSLENELPDSSTAGIVLRDDLTNASCNVSSNSDKETFFKPVQVNLESPQVCLTSGSALPTIKKLKKPSKYFQDPTMHHGPPTLSAGASGLDALSTQKEGIIPTLKPPHTPPPFECPPAADNVAMVTNDITTVTTNVVAQCTVTVKTAKAPFPTSVKPLHHTSLPSLSSHDMLAKNDSGTLSLYQPSFYKSTSSRESLVTSRHRSLETLYRKSFYNSCDYNLHFKQ